MTDADTVREALEIAGLYPINWRSHKFAALFALDRLVAERDEARADAKNAWGFEHKMMLRAAKAEGALKAAEAELRECRDSFTEVERVAMRVVAAEARCARLQQALLEMESAALKAAQLLPMTLSTSVEADHRRDHPSWAGWLLRQKVLPVAREALAAPDTPADSQPEETTKEAP